MKKLLCVLSAGLAIVPIASVQAAPTTGAIPAAQTPRIVHPKTAAERAIYETQRKKFADDITSFLAEYDRKQEELKVADVRQAAESKRSQQKADGLLTLAQIALERSQGLTGDTKSFLEKLQRGQADRTARLGQIDPIDAAVEGLPDAQEKAAKLRGLLKKQGQIKPQPEK